MNLDKIAKKLGEDTIQEMDALAEDALHKLIVAAEQSLKQAKEELDANEAYQKARNDVLILSQGFKDVKGRQNAKIQYALHRLSELGKTQG